MTPALVALLALQAPAARLGSLTLGAKADGPYRPAPYALRGVEAQRIASVTTLTARRLKATVWVQSLTPKKGVALGVATVSALSDGAAKSIVGTWKKREKVDTNDGSLSYGYRGVRFGGVPGDLATASYVSGGKVYRVLLFGPAKGKPTGEPNDATVEGTFEWMVFNSVKVSNAVALSGASSAVASGVDVGLNATEGETVHGERAFRVSVTTDTAINQVEFYVNGELRDTDTSTPYEFKLDTVAEAEGPVKLRFKAYTIENKTGEKSLTVNVDNEFSKGAEYHVGKANEALTDGKFAEARDEGKIALKLDKSSFGARLALARAYTGLNEFDQAQLQAEEAKALKPNDPAGLNVLAGINVRRAFLVYAKPGADRAEVLKQIKDALKGAVESRRAALDAGLDATPKSPALAYGDAAIAARRYGAAVEVLAPAFGDDQKNGALANRLAYAQLRTNRRQDAVNTLNTFTRAGGTLDAYGYALKAVALADAGDDQGSDDAMREAVLADSENLGVRTAQAFIALKRGNTTALSRLSADLSKDQGQRSDVRYIQMAYAARTQNYADAGRAFEVGVLAEPASADLFVEYANDAVAVTQRGTMDPKEKAQHYAEARAYFETALVARPEASEALSGLAMVAAFEGKPAEAVRYAQAAVASAPDDAGAHYALAAAQALYATALRATDANASGRASAAAQAANQRAGRLDAKYLGGRQIPDATAVWRYLDSAGRPTVLAAPTS